jgi:hypothetical protein
VNFLIAADAGSAAATPTIDRHTATAILKRITAPLPLKRLLMTVD